MTQEAQTTASEASKEKESLKEVKADESISQDQLKSLLDEHNKKVSESLEKQKKDLEKLLKITKEAKIEEQQQEQPKKQIDSFDAYRMQKQKERDEFLFDQMNPAYSIEARLAGKTENSTLDKDEKKLVQHHQETFLLKQLDRIIDTINTNSKSVYMPFKEQLETLRDDLRNFNYVKIALDYMDRREEHKKTISTYVRPHEIVKPLENDEFTLTRLRDDIFRKMYS